MRLDFNVLWVDDQPNAIQAQRESIERQIRKEGFRLQVEFATSLSSAEDFLSSNIFGDHIDLVLMDYDLGVGDKGDVGLGIVRKLFPYKDVIFYSSAAPDLPEKVASALVQGSKAHVQGIFCSTRIELPDSVVGAFDVLVKKVLDIDHSRGIVMGATSDIDHLVSDCLAAVYEKSDKDNQASTFTVLEKHLKEKKKCFDKELAIILTIQHMSELFDRHHIYTSNDRLRLLRNALNINKIHEDKAELMQRYMKVTVPKRNLLAHVRVKSEGFSRTLVDKDNNEFTSENMKELRRELLEYQELFESLAVELSKTTKLN